MSSSLTDILAFINDLLQAVIVIFGTAVVLYNLGRARRDRVTRAFCALISFVIITYFAETLVSQALLPISAEILLRLEWVGIAMVPAAQFHLSDALLVTTGAISRRRRLLVRAGYISGLVFLGLVLFSDWIVTAPADLLNDEARHLVAGPFFIVFAVYFWGVTAVSIYNVWRARRRCLTRTTRQRMTTTLLVFLAAPLSVFPYLILSSNAPQNELPIWLWLVVITGNVVVGIMFAIMTAHLIYFGAASPDRVVRVKLFKFMARVPMAASIVLVVYVLVQRVSPGIGIPVETAVAVAIVATVMLVEWAVHAYKRPLERFFHLNNDPDVQRIQQLSERLLTTSDLHQFLESILAATCEALRTPTSFVVAMTAAGPIIESIIGPLADPETLLQQESWQQLTHANGEETADLQVVDGFIVWQEYWLRPLHSHHRDDFLGILGIRARTAKPDLTEQEWHILDNLEDQIASALEDRILQQEVFAAVEGLLPQIIALQQRRSEAAFGGLPVFTAVAPADTVVNDPEFNSMVRDALRDYWGGPKLTKSPLMRLRIVQQAMEAHDNNATKALRAILNDAIELQKPEGERSLTTGEWILYNILELKFVQGQRVRDVARRLAMSESDLYRKQRVAIENVASTISELEKAALNESTPALAEPITGPIPDFSTS
jgi:hypothetical protein